MADRAAQAIEKPDNGYIDLLIDPNISEDSFDDLLITPGGVGSDLYQTVETGLYFRDSNYQTDAIFDSGISYTAYKPTANFGDFRLKLVGVDETDESYTSGVGIQTQDNTQQGLRWYSLEQIDFPLTENLAMDNTIGTHRFSYQRTPYRISSRINQRFGASRPLIFGLSSQLRISNTSFSTSVGKLGQSGSSLFPGFEETEGRISQVGFDSFLKQHFLSGDYWQIDDLDGEVDNRDGFRLSWDAPLTTTIGASATAANSGDSRAYLIGLLQQKFDLRHELGAYYFDPDFYWQETRLGNDNRGVYYQLSNRYGGINYGGSGEYRQDGLKTYSTNRRRDTLYLATHMGYRLGRNSTVNGGYSYRRYKGRDATITNDYSENTVRGNYSLRHSLNTNSNLGLRYRQRSQDFQRENDTTTRASYSLSHQFQSDSQGSLSLEYNRQNELDSRDSYSVNADWQKDLLNGSYLSLGVGYNYSESGATSNAQGMNARILHQWPFNRYFSLSTQVSYNRDYSGSEDDNGIDDGLVTEDPLDDSLDREYREGISATVRLSFNYGGSDSPQILSPHPGKSGSGIIRGRLFLDKNQDGVAQADEPGLEGVAVYLDSIYPTTTDSNGEYRFGSVGIGKHHLFVDESSLALPWTLNGVEYLPTQAKLRRTTVTNIPVGKIP